MRGGKCADARPEGERTGFHIRIVDRQWSGLKPLLQGSSCSSRLRVRSPPV